MNTTNPEGENNHLTLALTRLLTPLVRLLLSRGFTYTRLIQILRPLYVRLAEEEYSQPDGNMTDSRISVLTGLARRYVKELREIAQEPGPETLKSSPSVKLIAEWVTNPAFLDKKGLPRTLHRLEDPDGRSGFEGLARIASSDVRAKTLLDDLLGKGMIEIDGSGRVRLLTRAYRADHHHTEMIDYVGQHLHDHIAAAARNLDSGDGRFFERSAFQDKLTADSVRELDAIVEQEGMSLLRLVYARAAELAKQDAELENNSFRFRIGAYCYSENESEPQSGSDDPG